MCDCLCTLWLFGYLEDFTFNGIDSYIPVLPYVWLFGMWLFGGSTVFMKTTGKFINKLKITWDDADGVKSERYDDRRRGVVHGVDRKGLNFNSNKSQKMKFISYLKLLKNRIRRRLCSTNVSCFSKFQPRSIFWWEQENFRQSRQSERTSTWNRELSLMSELDAKNTCHLLRKFKSDMSYHIQTLTGQLVISSAVLLRPPSSLYAI